MRLVFVSVAAGCLIALAGCGGGGGGDSTSDPEADAIAASIDAAFTGADAHACEDVQTQAFLEQTFFQQGSAVVKACESLTGDSLASSVDVSDVQVDGSTATATVAVEGSAFDGQTVDLGLVEEDGTWKVDELTGFEDFDQEAYADALLAVTAAQGFDQGAAACAADNMRSADEGELEDAILSGDPDRLTSYSEGCS